MEKEMNVAVFGLGYVGFTAACCIASEGHCVIGVDVNPDKVADVEDGIPLFEEPGLAELMRTVLDEGRLRATVDARAALEDADLAIVCVGTPSGLDGAHDMRHVIDVTRQLAKAVKDLNKKEITVSYRSTMRPGSIRHLISPVFSSVLGAGWKKHIELVYNPEFLREAQAIKDYFHPSKIVVGTENGQPSDVMTALHGSIDAPLFYTSFEEAEITKFVDNSWHAAKVVFANEIGRVCQKLSISASVVHKIFAADTKLNISTYYTRPGGAFGGSCLPKDVRALQFISTDVGANTHLLDSLLRSNEAHKNHQFDQVMAMVPSGGKVLLVGLAFKAGTDDLRESPNLDLARKLLNSGVKVKIFDPALEPAKLRGQNLGYAYSNLPTIDELLIDRRAVNSENWDAVVINSEFGEKLDVSDRNVLVTHTIT